MGFHWPFFARPQPTDDTLPMRAPGGQFTSSPKTKRETHNRASVNAQLGVYVAITPADKRRAETEAYWAAARGEAA